MNVFRKKATKTTCCGGDCTSETMQKAEVGKGDKGIKILGSGCAKCIALEKAVIIAIHELDMDVSIQHISDSSQIASYGVMTTPALVVDGKVVSYGKVLRVAEIKDILHK